MDILNKIRQHTFDTAFLKGLLIGQKIDEIELPSDITHQIADRIIIDFEQLHPIKNIDDIRHELLKGFVYMFDKGVEISYFSRLLQDTKVEYNFNDLLNGISGDTFPVYIQVQVNPMIPVLADIYNSTFEFMHQNESSLAKSNIDAKELMKLILIGGAFLGVEYCLRIELQQDN